MSRLRALAFALPLLALGCAGLGGGEPPASEVEQREYAAALAPLAKNPAEARKRLDAFLMRHPQSPLADDASMRLAEIARARRDLETASRHYRRVIVEYPRGDHVDSARLSLARLELSRGNRPAAESLLRGLRLMELSDAERTLAYRVHADVASDPVDRLRWLSRARAAEPGAEAVARTDAEIDATLAPLAADELRRAAEEIEPEIPAARAWLRAAELELASGDRERARGDFERAQELPMTPADATRMRALEPRFAQPAAERFARVGVLEELPSLADAARRGGAETEGAQGTLGVVLPLTGRLARFGEESLQGVLLAAGVFGEAGGRRVRVLVRDSEGRPERAAAAVAELAARPEVVGIVGPLLSAEAEAAAGAADAGGVPLLPLAAREELGRASAQVFRVRALPREEVALLVDHAMGDLGARRFAIFYPRDAYGRGLRRLFWEAVDERGGEIVAVAGYEPGATDFGAPIRALLGYELLGAAERGVLAKREEMETKARRLPPAQGAALLAEARALTGPDGAPLPPILDFDAIFLPESHEKVVLIAPQLAFHDVRGVRLLGTTSWNDPALVSIGRDHVEGARFPAGFFAGSPVPLVQDFAAAYEAAYAGPPAEFAALAFDATNLLLEPLTRSGASRDDVREALEEAQERAGATGVLSLGPAGAARKRPLLLGVERGQIVEIE